MNSQRQEVVPAQPATVRVFWQPEFHPAVAPARVGNSDAVHALWPAVLDLGVSRSLKPMVFSSTMAVSKESCPKENKCHSIGLPGVMRSLCSVRRRYRRLARKAGSSELRVWITLHWR